MLRLAEEGKHRQRRSQGLGTAIGASRRKHPSTGPIEAIDARFGQVASARGKKAAAEGEGAASS
jgi:hypothetical protein